MRGTTHSCYRRYCACCKGQYKRRPWGQLPPVGGALGMTTTTTTGVVADAAKSSFIEMREMSHARNTKTPGAAAATDQEFHRM